MLWIEPRAVLLDGAAWDGVRSVVVSRGAAKSVVEFGGLGPHVEFADVPQQRVEVRVERSIDDGAEMGASVGDSLVLEFEVARGQSDSMRRRVEVTGVLLSVDVDGGGERGGRARYRIVGVSADGVTDPVQVSDVQS